MVARDLTTGKVTQPTPRKENPNFDAKDPGSPKYLPSEPHIGLSGRNAEQREATVQTGFARGGSTGDVEGQSLNAEQLDNTGKVVKESPGEVSRIVHDEGPHAANKAMGGPDTPPGDPDPSAKGKSGKGSK